MPPETVCPACSGTRMANHPGGALEFQHGPICGLRDTEDATRAADREHADQLGREWFNRPTTATEATLLVAFGVAAHPVTRVDYLTRGVRRRTWPN